MKRTWTIIGVADVPQSSLLGLPETAPAHDYFGQILESDGRSCSVSTSGVPTSIRR
jgi:hypothetical protein